MFLNLFMHVGHGIFATVPTETFHACCKIVLQPHSYSHNYSKQSIAISLSYNAVSFGPVFSVSSPITREGDQLLVHLSAPILTQSFVPAFNGRIEVDITAEDLPAGDPNLWATFGEYSHNFCEIRNI